MIPDIHLEAQDTPAPRLFPFTPAEEAAMRRAIRSSIRFFQTFGLAPKQPEIDLSHYENTDKTKWYYGN